jgi:RNA polymerase sigma factor (sigma-70 family)
MPTTLALRQFLANLAADATDAELLAQFAAHRPEAFAELVRRHGPMVRGVARRTVRDTHLADDVTQAVFLVLARKAARLAHPECLAGWLFGVATRLSRKAAARQRRAAPLPIPDRAAPPAPAADDWVRVLDEELARLPDVERSALTLCHLEGRTQDEAARACGWSVRTLRRRLAAGRERLRLRLERRGVELGVVLLAVAVAVRRAPAAPVTLDAPSDRVAALVRAELSPVGRVAGAVLAAAVLVVGVASPTSPAPQPPKPVAEAKPAAAEDAVRLGTDALRHSDRLTQLRFTADGKQLLTYGGGKLRKWDAATGEAVPHPTRDIATTFGKTLLSPNADHLIAPHLDHEPIRFSVRDYDLASGKHAELFVIPPRLGPDKQPAGIGLERFVLSPDSNLLIEGSRNGVYLWDLKARAVRHELKVPNGTTHFVFTPDSKQLLTASDTEKAVRFWDVVSGREVSTLTAEGQRGGLLRLELSADGRFLAAVDNSHLLGTGTNMSLWDLTNPGPPKVVTLRDGYGLSGCLAFGPDGVLYAVSQAPERGTRPVLTKWDVAAGKQLARWAGPHSGEYGPMTAAVNRDGTMLAVGNMWGVVHLYDTRTGAEAVRPSAHAAAVVGVSFDATGREVRTTGGDSSNRTWDAATGALRVRRDSPVPVPVEGLSLSVVPSPDGQWAVSFTANVNGSGWDAELWDAATGRAKHTLTVGGRVKELLAIPGGTLLGGLIETRGGNQLLVWDTDTGASVSKDFPPLKNQWDRHAISPDGKTFLVGSETKIAGYDVRTGEERFAWNPAENGVLGRKIPEDDHRPGLVSAVAASPDGKTLAVSIGGEAYIDLKQRTHNLVLVEAATGKVIRREPTPVTSSAWLVFSPDGKWLAGSHAVWDVGTLKEVRRFRDYPVVSAAAFSPDGRRIATGHTNGTATVWDIRK